MLYVQIDHKFKKIWLVKGSAKFHIYLTTYKFLENINTSNGFSTAYLVRVGSLEIIK
jgi:hypothetical protein